MLDLGDINTLTSLVFGGAKFFRQNLAVYYMSITLHCHWMHTSCKDILWPTISLVTIFAVSIVDFELPMLVAGGLVDLELDTEMRWRKEGEFRGDTTDGDEDNVLSLSDLVEAGERYAKMGDKLRNSGIVLFLADRPGDIAGALTFLCPICEIFCSVGLTKAFEEDEIKKLPASTQRRVAEGLSEFKDAFQ